MLNIGFVIAAGVLVIYVILGPIVILGFYAFFDRMADNASENEGLQKKSLHDKDPALWSAADVRKYMKTKRHLQPGGSRKRL